MEILYENKLRNNELQQINAVQQQHQQQQQQQQQQNNAAASPVQYNTTGQKTRGDRLEVRMAEYLSYLGC
jgi:hypothetical protein